MALAVPASRPSAEAGPPGTRLPDSAGMVSLGAVAGIVTFAGCLLMAIGFATAWGWLPYLLGGQRVIGRVVSSQGSFARYSYPWGGRFHSGETGSPPPADAVSTGSRPIGANIELLVLRSDAERSLALEQIEPLEIMPLVGLGLLLLAYGAGGLVIVWRAASERTSRRLCDKISRLLAAARLPLGVLICSLLGLAILSWCAPLAWRWLVAGIALTAQTGLVVVQLYQAATTAPPPRPRGEREVMDEASTIRFPLHATAAAPPANRRAA